MQDTFARALTRPGQLVRARRLGILYTILIRKIPIPNLANSNKFISKSIFDNLVLIYTALIISPAQKVSHMTGVLRNIALLQP